MDAEDLERLLREVSAGDRSVESALRQIEPFAELGFANLDLQREQRTGVPEAVFAQGKSDEELVRIVDALVERTGRLLVTRLDRERGALLSDRVPDGRYHARARCFVLAESRATDRSELVAVLAAGTSDLAVAEEAAVVAEWLGLGVERHFDVGIAGVQRLLDRLPEIRRARAVIAVAGMDGALPTLVAGLVAAPVIAVPTSVGYGASFGGLAALLTMLNGCAPGLAVVNIDNGFGAAAMAARVVRAGRETGALDQPRNMASPYE